MNGFSVQTRVALVCLSLIGATWSMQSSAADPAGVTASRSLADYARRSEGAEFYGVYLLGTKVGWGADESRLVQHQGKSVFENRYEILLEVGTGASRSRLSMKGETRYALDADGAIVAMKEIEDEGGGAIERSAVRNGDSLRISSIENGKISERTVVLPRDTLKQQRDLQLWLDKGPKKGDVFTTYEVSLGDEQIETESTVEFLEHAQLVWGGVPVSASRVTMRSQGIGFNALFGANGKLMNGKIGGLFEIRAEEEAVAKAPGAKLVDMLAASRISVATRLGDNDGIRSLTLQLSSPEDFQLPSSARQRVQPLGKGLVQVQLTREAETPAATALTATDRQKYLRATPGVQSEDEAIRALARQIADDAKDPLEIATRIVHWVDSNVRDTYGANASTATAVLAQRAGDCTEHSLLFTALARAAGVPARQLGGIMYADRPSPMFGWHAWAEVHDGRGWISVDPTWGQVRVDPTHVQFSIGGDDAGENMSWVNVVGTLQIKVDKVETAGSRPL